jgi:DsbC/DsbD-like thiol-disulfide interchange protein
MLISVVFGLFVSVAIVPPARGQGLPESYDSSQIAVSLVSDVSSIKPGQSFHIGVHFVIAPPWHIYWKNPGDAGLPTRLSWQLPEAFSAGPINWPIPQVFMQAGNLIGYGYAGQALFVSQVTASANLSQKEIEFKADVHWLGCADVCVLGAHVPSLRLKVGDGKSSPQAALFTQWEKRYPKAAAEASDLRWHSQWEYDLHRRQGAIKLTISWLRPIKQSVSFLPVPPKGLELMNTQTGTGTNQSWFSSEIRTGQGVDLPKVLEFLVILRGVSGEDEAFTVMFPLENKS